MSNELGLDRLTLSVNGHRRSFANALAHTSALDWLRSEGLTGSKEGCAEGECGACAVMVADSDGEGGTSWTSVNSCLIPVASLDGQELVTAEGLGTPAALHEVQAGLAEIGGSQCGYCTPGFVCSMAAEFYRRDRRPTADAALCSDSANVLPSDAGLPTRETVGEAVSEAEHDCGPNGFRLHALTGNLCRCTGYRPIRDAAYALGQAAPGDALAARLLAPAPSAIATVFAASDGRYVRPQTLTEALALLANNPTAIAVAGSTDWGVEVNLRGRRSPLVVALSALPKLREVTVTGDAVEFGAALTLAELERALAGRVPLLSSLIPQFASPLIRNRATIGGNLGTGSPIGDAAPALLALNATLVLVSGSGERTVALKDYFTGYRETVRKPAELIRSVRIPMPLAPLTAFHKIAKRRYDDISSVAVAFALEIEDDTIVSARIGLGGVAATPIRASATEDLLLGRRWNAEVVREAATCLRNEGTPMDDHRASARYRCAMLEQSLLKIYAENPHGADCSRVEVRS